MYVLCVLDTELPYHQGYNDNLTQFLLVLELEVDCYWIFKMYVEKRMILLWKE